MSNIAACIDCGHPHSPQFGWICIGCRCETRPIGYVEIDEPASTWDGDGYLDDDIEPEREAPDVESSS